MLISMIQSQQLSIGGQTVKSNSKPKLFNFFGKLVNAAKDPNFNIERSRPINESPYSYHNRSGGKRHSSASQMFKSFISCGTIQQED